MRVDGTTDRPWRSPRLDLGMARNYCLRLAQSQRFAAIVRHISKRKAARDESYPTMSDVRKMTSIASLSHLNSSECEFISTAAFGPDLGKPTIRTKGTQPLARTGWRARSERIWGMKCYTKSRGKRPKT